MIFCCSVGHGFRSEVSNVCTRTYCWYKYNTSSFYTKTKKIVGCCMSFAKEFMYPRQVVVVGCYHSFQHRSQVDFHTSIRCASSAWTCPRELCASILALPAVWKLVNNCQSNIWWLEDENCNHNKSEEMADGQHWFALEALEFKRITFV
jgi:hypothetical protein